MNFKKLERYLRVNLLGPGPRHLKKRIYRPAVSQWLRNTAVHYMFTFPSLMSKFVGW